MGNRQRCTYYLASALASGVVLTAPAVAQDEAPPQATAGFTGNEIIVTARRFEERLQDVPISITVFNQEQLDNRNIVNPSELATYTPSLSVNRQFGQEKSSFSIRGFTQEVGTQPSVAVYFADVVAPRSQGFSGGGNGTLPGTLFDLQSVQVLKGPQGTLFGRNTTGGAVLLVPQRPTDRAEGYFEATIGNYDAVRVQAVVNAPLSDRARLRLSFDKMTRDGYLRNRSGIGPNDFADVDYHGLRASLVLDLTDTIENYTVVSYNNSDTNNQLPRIIACARDPMTRTPSQFLADFGCAQLDRQNARGDGFYDVENDVTNPYVHLRQWQAINTTTWEASDTLTIKNIVSYSEYREASRFNVFGDRLLVPLPPTFTTSLPFHGVEVNPGPSGDVAAQYTITEELQFQGRSADDRLIWQAGGYLEISNPLEPGTQVSELFMSCDETLTLQGCVAPLAPFFGSVALRDEEYRFRNYAAYAQATYDFTEQFSLTAGIRYTSDRLTANGRNASARFSTTFGPPTFICSRTGAPIASFAAREGCRDRYVEKSSRPTWLIGLDYKPNPDTLIYAKYARGYRQGTLNLALLDPALTNSGPEKVDTYEIGAKLSFDGAISGNFNIAAFYNDFTDQQLQVNTQCPFPATGVPCFPLNIIVNAGQSRMSGLEIDASLLPFEGLRLDLAYAYLDTELQSFDPPPVGSPYLPTFLGTAVEGDPLVYSPKHRITASATYTLPLPEDLGRMSVGATYTHTAKQFSTHADDTFVPQFGFNPGLLPATDLLNLNANWNSVGGGPFDLALFATNVTKEKYRVAVSQVGQIGFETALIGEPRMYGLRLRYNFGER